MHLSLENLRNPSVCATGGGVRIAPWSRRAYGWVVNDDVIDLTRYLARTPPDSEQEGARGNFSVWGGEGERSRFALPIWRSIYLVGGGRGGGGAVLEGEDAVPESLFVLDLAAAACADRVRVAQNA
jgi:hypothetical protein